MSHFHDLSGSPRRVGWLARGFAFPRKPASPEFVDALANCVRYPAIVHRGYHVCDLCTGSPEFEARKRLLER